MTPIVHRVLLRAALLTILYTGAVYGQAILAPGGRTLFNKNLLIRSFSRIERQSVTRNGSIIRNTTYVQPLALVYGVAPNWNLTAVVPFVVAESSGWADAQFFVKYDGLVKKNVPGGTTRLGAEFGVQAPTGADRFSPGAFAFLGDLVFHTARNRKFLIADVQYRAATRNDQGVSAGNSFGFDIASAYLWLPASDGGLGRLLRHGLIPLVELNGEVQNRVRTRAGALRDTGGITLLLSPGLQYFPRPNWILEFSLPIPVLRDLNGSQPKRLVGFLVGFRYVL